MKLPLVLLKEAEMESYTYFDAHIRALPKTQDGDIDTLQPGFQNNDVDAFRHAYVSGVFSLEYGEKVAKVLGWMNEFFIPTSAQDRRMDFWNNAVGRSLARHHREKKSLILAIEGALRGGELIVNLSDERGHEEALIPKPEGQNAVTVLQQNSTGANEMFFDLASSKTMSRIEFSDAIADGLYPGYEVRMINGSQYPASRRDSSRENNLG